MIHLHLSVVLQQDPYSCGADEAALGQIDVYFLTDVRMTAKRSISSLLAASPSMRLSTTISQLSPDSRCVNVGIIFYLNRRI